MRVLLADDHSIVRRGLRGLLEAAGLTVVGEASDGLEAVRLCEEQRPDIVFCEYDLLATVPLESWERDPFLSRVPVMVLRGDYNPGTMLHQPRRASGVSERPAP